MGYEVEERVSQVETDEIVLSTFRVRDRDPFAVGSGIVTLVATSDGEEFWIFEDGSIDSVPAFPGPHADTKAAIAEAVTFWIGANP